MSDPNTFVTMVGLAGLAFLVVMILVVMHFARLENDSHRKRETDPQFATRGHGTECANDVPREER